jgi:hypothetical protein
VNLPRDILHVFAVFARSSVKCLLMGGQACVHYGAAEFSKDIDFAILSDEANLAALSQTLGKLHAELIAVPPFERRHLENGQALHFRCTEGPAKGMRIDVMSRMRGVAPFAELWKRRTTLTLPGGLGIEVLGLRDLVQAKKTQRDKDWPMIARLVEVHYLNHRGESTATQREFWFRELRNADLLTLLAAEFAEEAAALAGKRPAIAAALAQQDVRRALRDEEERERAADQAYWEPLKKQLEELRRRKA